MKKKYLILLLVGLVIIGSYYGIQLLKEKNTSINTGTNPGELAPDFTLKTISDNNISLSDYRGKKVFLNFWATFCPPCQQEMPDIQKLYVENKDIVVLTVNLGDSKKEILDFLITRKLDLPVLMDMDQRVAEKFLVKYIPTTYIVDEKGIIIDKRVGALNYQEMLALVKKES